MNVPFPNISTSTQHYPITNTSTWPASSSSAKDSIITKIIMGTICASVSGVGLPTSLLIVCTIVKHKELRTCQNAFLASLALRDMITLGCIVPAFCASFILGLYPFGESICIIQLTCGFSLGIGTVLELMNIAISRFVKICCPIGTYRIIYNQRNTGLFIALSWGISFLLSIPLVLQSGGLKDDRCFIPKSVMKAIVTSFILGIAIAVTSICYFNILKTVRNAKSNLKKFNEGPARQKRVKQNVQKSFRDFMVFAIYLFLLLPFVLLNSFGLSRPTSLSWEIAKLVSFLNNFSNCFIYGILNKQLRFFFCRLLSCRRQFKSRNVVHPFTITVTNTRPQPYLGTDNIMSKDSVCVRYPNTVLHVASSNATIVMTDGYDDYKA